MTEEKRNRVFAALTVNAVILLAVLVAVVIYQLVQIVVLSNRKQAVRQQIIQYEQQIEEENDKLEKYKTEEWLMNKAYEYGFIFPGEN